MPDDKILAEKINENQIANEAATNKRNALQRRQRAEAARRLESERLKAEQEQNEFLQRQFLLEQQARQKESDLQKQQEQIEREQREKEESDKAKQDALDKISEESEKKIEALGPRPNNFRLEEGRRVKDKQSLLAVKRWVSARDKIADDTRTATQKVLLRHSGLPQWAITQALRQWNPTDFKSTSAVSLAKQLVKAQEEKAESARLTSITNAKSNAIIEDAKLQETIREFESKRDSGPTLLSDGQLKIKSSESTVATATKSRPTIKDSSFFQTNVESVIPQSILGTTDAKSRQAILTFEGTQSQQKKLFAELTSAANSKEAIKIRSRFRDANPLVGTANVLLRKGGVVSQSGFLIEKKLNKKIGSDSIDSSLLSPVFSLSKFEGSSAPEQTLKEIQDESGLVPSTSNGIPTFIFLDADGNTRQASQEELFSFASELIDLKPKSLSEKDMRLNKVIFENFDDIVEAEANSDDETGSVQPLLANFPFERAFLDHATELRASIENLFKPESEQETFNPTLESLAIGDLIEGGKNLLFGSSDETESQAIKFLKEKAKTPEGIQEVAGSILGSGIAAGAAILFPPLAAGKAAKVTSKVVTVKNKKRAEQLAAILRQPAKDPEVEKMLAKFPDMPEAMKQQARKQLQKQNPVQVEMLDPQTALITRGTELSNTQTPFIVARFGGKNPRGTLFQTATPDEPGAFKEIIVSGIQNKELEKGIVLSSKKVTGKTVVKEDFGKSGQRIPEKIETTTVKDEIVSFPATRENIIKASDSTKLSPIGTKKDVLMSDLESNPAIIIKNVESQKIKTGSIILETERKNPIKSLNQDVRKLPKAGELKNTPSPKTSLNKIKTTISTKKDITLDVDIPSSSKPQISTKTINPIKTRKEKLEKIARNTTTTPKAVNAKVLSSAETVSLVTQRIRSDNALKQNAINLDIQKPKQGSLLEVAVTPKLQSEVSVGVQTVQKSPQKIRTELETVTKNQPILNPKFSLIISREETKEGIVPRAKVLVKQQEILTTPPIVPQPEKTPPIARIPSGGIQTPNVGLGVRDVRRGKGKITVGFFRWNVNTESVGGTLPTADLVIGKTQKTIRKVDALERKINKKNARRSRNDDFDIFPTGKKSKKGKRNRFGIF